MIGYGLQVIGVWEPELHIFHMPPVLVWTLDDGIIDFGCSTIGAVSVTANAPLGHIRLGGLRFYCLTRRTRRMYLYPLARRTFKEALGQLFILLLRDSETKALGKFSA